MRGQEAREVQHQHQPWESRGVNPRQLYSNEIYQIQCMNWMYVCVCECEWVALFCQLFLPHGHIPLVSFDVICCPCSSSTSKSWWFPIGGWVDRGIHLLLFQKGERERDASWKFVDYNLRHCCWSVASVLFLLFQSLGPGLECNDLHEDSFVRKVPPLGNFFLRIRCQLRNFD